MKPINFKHTLVAIAPILICIGVGLYFRTYTLHHPVPERSSKEIARFLVYEKIKKQLRNSLNGENANLSETAKSQLVEQKAAEITKTEKVQFDQAVQSMAKSLKVETPIGTSRHYLLESDPYYYYYLTREIERTGSIAKEFQGGKYFNPLRRAPLGFWPAVTLHPYLGFWWSKLFQVLNPQADLMESLCYFPLVLVVLIAIIFWFVCSLLEIGTFASFVGCFSFLLSPIFVQRSSFGWYDTDPYQYIFPPLVIAAMLVGARQPKRALWLGVLGGFLTGFYSLFWSGWPFVFVLVVGSGTLILCANRLLKWSPINPAPLLISYIVSTIFFGLIFMTPSGFLESFSNVQYVREFAQEGAQFWPNAFLTVGEATPVSVLKLLSETSSFPIVLLALLGAGTLLLKAWQERNFDRLFQFVILFAGFSVTFLMALSTERFAVLWVLFVPYFVACGAEFLTSFLTSFIQRVPKIPRTFQKSAAIILILLCTAPFLIRSVYAAMDFTTLIMNDTWYEALIEMKEKIPEDAIVDNWWPPGYFIQAIAERKSVGDGGTQHLPETLWVAKAFLADNEKESAGIFRMINLSGNRGMVFLESSGFSTQGAMDFLSRLAPVGRENAEKKIAGRLSESKKSQLLDLLYPKIHVPAYVFIYNDEIEQNLALSVMANWNFDRAKELNAEKPAASRRVLSLPALLSETLDRWLPNRRLRKTLDNLFRVTNGVWKYTGESKLLKNDDGILRFENGVMINPDSLDVFVPLDGQKSFVHPMSLFYIENGRLVEKSFDGDRADASCLLIRRGDTASVVLADPRLIRSTLFRLYYLNGEGLRIFKPIISKTDSMTQTTIKVFQIDWNQFEQNE